MFVFLDFLTIATILGTGILGKYLFFIPYDAELTKWTSKSHLLKL